MYNEGAVLSITIISFLSVLFFLISNVIYRIAGIRLKGNGAHPLSLLVIVQFCIFSFPGVIAISFFGIQSERYAGISDSVRFEIGMWYVYSIVVFMFCSVFFLKIFNVKNYNRFVATNIDSITSRRYAVIIVTLALLALIAKLIFSKTPPLLYLISGNAEMAYNARIDIQTNPQSYYLPYISNVISLLSVFQFYLVFYIFTFSSRRGKGKLLLLLLSFVLAATECLYETQKAPIVFLFLGIIFIIYLRSQAIMKLLLMFLIVAVMVVVLQAYVIDANLTDAFNTSLDRFILGQNQGFYHIINSIKPNDKYWFSSFYFIERLGITPARADVDVIPYIDIYKNVDIVNVNSYYLGEAWSMFGYYGLVFSPLIVGFSVALFVKILDLLIGFNPIFFIPFSIYIIPEFRINQAFNYFLYGKEFVFKLLMVIFIALVVSTLERIRIGVTKWNKRES